jgi:hypothetical protein
MYKKRGFKINHGWAPYQQLQSISVAGLLPLVFRYWEWRRKAVTGIFLCAVLGNWVMSGDRAELGPVTNRLAPWPRFPYENTHQHHITTLTSPYLLLTKLISPFWTVLRCGEVRLILTITSRTTILEEGKQFLKLCAKRHETRVFKSHRGTRLSRLGNDKSKQCLSRHALRVFYRCWNRSRKERRLLNSCFQIGVARTVAIWVSVLASTIDA